MRFVLVIIITIFLVACGEDSQTGAATQSQSETASPTANTADDEAAAAYQAKVQKRVSNFANEALAREWGVSEDKIICLRKDLRFSQLDDPSSDPEALAVFEKCGVDPAVAD